MFRILIACLLFTACGGTPDPAPPRAAPTCGLSYPLLDALQPDPDCDRARSLLGQLDAMPPTDRAVAQGLHAQHCEGDETAAVAHFAQADPCRRALNLFALGQSDGATLPAVCADECSYRRGLAEHNAGVATLEQGVASQAVPHLGRAVELLAAHPRDRAESVAALVQARLDAGHDAGAVRGELHPLVRELWPRVPRQSTAALVLAQTAAVLELDEAAGLACVALAAEIATAIEDDETAADMREAAQGASAAGCPLVGGAVLRIDGQPADFAQLPPPGPRDAVEPVAVVPGAGELGSWYVVRAQDVSAWPVEQRRVVWSRSRGALITVDDCAERAPVIVTAWPVVPGSGPSLPPAVAARGQAVAIAGQPVTVQLDRTVPGPAWVAVQLGGTPAARVCLRGIGLAEPLAAGAEYWCTPAGACADMAVGGGSPTNHTTWTQRLWRGQ